MKPISNDNEEENSQMLQEEQFNTTIDINNKEYKNEIENIKRRNKFYLPILFVIIIIFLNVSLFIKVDKTKNISRKTALTRAKFYMKKCFEGKFMNNNTFYSFHKPKISVVIPVYNCKDTIKAAVRSIQNQNMAEIEIYLVNDYSKDITPKIIQELSEEDYRIKVINNKKNMGTLYSRNIGILQSKGKYIMNLDNDDLFIDIDVFDVVYEEAEKDNYDIVGFGAVDAPSYNPLLPQIYDDYFHSHENGLIVRQPELTYFPYVINNKFTPNDFHVWGRLVKTNLYKKAINNFGISALGEERKLNCLSWTEDVSISVVLFRFAESYKFIQKYGIFHYVSKKTASNTRPKHIYLYDEIFFLDILYDFTDNNEKRKKYVVDKAKLIRNQGYFSYDNERNVLFLKAVFRKILNCKYITEKDKNELKKRYKGLGFD